MWYFFISRRHVPLLCLLYGCICYLSFPFLLFKNNLYGLHLFSFKILSFYCLQCKYYLTILFQFLFSSRGFLGRGAFLFFLPPKARMSLECFKNIFEKIKTVQFLCLLNNHILLPLRHGLCHLSMIYQVLSIFKVACYINVFQIRIINKYIYIARRVRNAIYFN